MSLQLPPQATTYLPARTHLHPTPFLNQNQHPVVRLCRYDQVSYLSLHYRAHIPSLYALGQHIQRGEARRAMFSSLTKSCADPVRSGSWAVSGHKANMRTCTQNTTCDAVMGSGRPGSWDMMHIHPNNTVLASNHPYRPQQTCPHTQTRTQPHFGLPTPARQLTV